MVHMLGRILENLSEYLQSPPLNRGSKHFTLGFNCYHKIVCYDIVNSLRPIHCSKIIIKSWTP